MILHLVHDEKIINRTIDLFETAFPNENLFIVFTRKGFKFVRQADNTIPFLEFESRMKDYNITSIVIHNMNSRKIKFIENLYPSGIPAYWIIWGADLYNKLLEPKGFKMIDKQSAYYKSLRLKRLLSAPYDAIKRKIRTKKNIDFINKRIQYIVTDTTESDYDMLLKYYPHLNHIPWRDFFYYPIDAVLGDELMNKYVDRSNIQIGNSASLTNNHEYAMHILSKLQTGDRNIIVPLSYSGNDKYKESVIKKGKQLFDKNFTPLMDFMPLDDYNKLLISVNVAIYGNWRQEAIGNILISLYLGAKVFLSHTNPVFEWAQNHGLKVFELEKMTQEDIDTPLCDIDIELNREKLIQLYNKDRLYELIKESFTER